MALADTAALIASLELQDKFSSTVSKYDKAVSGMQAKTNTLSKIGGQINQGARTAITNVGRIAAVGAGLVASQVALGVQSLAQLEEVKNQTDAVIKSTGAAANVTAEQIRTLSESLENISTVDDKAIQSGANLLLTFTNIRNEAGKGNDIFNQATETLLDLSVAMGTEPKAAAVQLGKALNDPVKGITALTRVGVTFSEEQKKQIENFVETNRVAEAQKVILAELQKEFGGSAKAFGKGPAADMRRFGDAIEGAQQALATGFLPVIQRVSQLVQEGLGSKEVQANIKSFGEGLAGGVEDLIDIGLKLPWDAIGQSAKLMGQGAKALLDAFTGLPPWIQTAVLTGWGLNKLTGGALGNIAGTLTGALARGLFAGRGGTPATPVFTKEVGIPGTGGAPGVPGVGGRLGGVLGLAGLIAAPVAAGLALADFVRTVEDVDAKIGHNFFDNFGKGGPVPVDIVATSTPLGQFVAANQGGTPLQTGTPAGSGADNSITIGIDSMHKDIQAALRRGDIEQARQLKGMVDALRGLDNRSENRTNAIVAGIGKTNQGLSIASRKLDDGNRRQQDLVEGIREARDRIGSGFQANNDQLRAINSKDFSPNVNVTVPVTTTVAVNDIIRVWSHVTHAEGTGFGPGATVSAQLLVRQGGGAAAEVDVANLDPDDFPVREGVPFFDSDASLILLGQRWEQGTAAQGAFTYVDPHANHTHEFRPHSTVKLVEDSLSPEAILAYGRIEGGNDTRRRSAYIPGDEVEHSSIGFMDCNMDLRGLPFLTDWYRPAEDSWERLQALHAAKLNGSSSTASPHRSTTNLGCDRFTNDHLVDATSPVDLAAKNYPSGTTVEQVMQDIMEEWGKGWGITIHHGPVDSHRCILVQDLDDLTKFTSELRISDQLADWAPDHGTHPTKEPHWRRSNGKQLENSHVISGLLSKYSGTQDNPHHVTVSTGEAPEDWEIWWDVYEDDLSDGEVQATRRANNILNDRKRPYTTNMPSILMNPNQVKLITAGQAIQVKSVVMNQGSLKHDWVWRRIAQIEWEPVPDGRWWAHLELDRPRGSKPRVGGGQPGSTSPKPAPPPTPDEPGTTSHLWTWATNNLDTVDGTSTAFRQAGTAHGWPPADAAFGASGVYGANAAGFYQTSALTVTAGTDYTFSTDIMWRYDPTFRGLVVSWYSDSGGNTLISSDDFVVGPGHGTGTAYHESVTLTAPVSAIRARVVDPHHFAGIFLDNLTMGTAGTVTPDDPDALPDGGDSPYYARSDDPRFTNDDQHLSSHLDQRVINNSGVTLVAGDVVVPDTTLDGPAVTRTTTASTTAGPVGVVMNGAADDAEVVVRWFGAATFVNTNGTPADGDYLFTSTTAGVADCSATRATGAFGRVVRDDGAGETLHVLLWGVPDTTSGSSTTVATDTIWDAKGDLAAGTGADTASKLTVGANGTFLKADSAQSTGLTWATAGDVTVNVGGNLADVPPTSAGTYDEEFSGTADTLPTNWAWTSAPSGSDLWSLNSRWPGLLTVEGTGNAAYTLTRTNFTAAATFGLWFHYSMGPIAAADKAQCKLYILNSGATEGRSAELRVSAANAVGVRSLKTVASAESVWGANVGVGNGTTSIYFGITRTSNNWAAFYSFDGISWSVVGATEAHTFTVDRFRFSISTYSAPSVIALHWVRYRTDTNFPRI